MPKLGAHMSIAGGVDCALERGASIGCEAVQIFLKNNMQWDGKPLATDEIARFHQQRLPVFAHSSYLINPASLNPVFRQRSIVALIDEINRATLLGVPFIVLHPGAQGDLLAATQSLDAAFAATKRSPVQIALETTAGQGSCLGHRFEHLATIIQSSKYPARLAVCVDTCHIFAAGYDIRTPAGYRTTVHEMDQTFGCNRVVAFHLNDSKKPLGSRVDRHEHIGKGHLGLPAFRNVLRDERWHDLLMVLETPKGPDLAEDVENLRVLRRLVK